MVPDFDASLCSFTVPIFTDRGDFGRWLAKLSAADRSRVRQLQITRQMFGNRIVRGRDRWYGVSMSMDEFNAYKLALDVTDEPRGG